jgi:hypothetical protein
VRIGGLGGVVNSVRIETQIRLTREGGGKVLFRGQFVAVTALETLDMSVIGRDLMGPGEARILVEKSGIPVAAIVSTDDLERLRRLEAQRAGQLKVLEESWRAFADVSPEDVEEEVAKAVAAARRKKRQRGSAAASTS